MNKRDRTEIFLMHCFSCGCHINICIDVNKMDLTSADKMINSFVTDPAVKCPVCEGSMELKKRNSVK